MTQHTRPPSPRLSRRRALALPPLVAATLALPELVEAAPPPAPEEPAIIHPALCFHEKYRAEKADPERNELAVAFHDALSPEQWALYREVEAWDINDWAAEQDAFVDELCRWFPGLAPAIRGIAYHAMGGQLCDLDPDDRTPWSER